MRIMNSKELAKNIRLDTLRMVTESKSSHIGGVYSSADILAVLYADVMSYNSSNPDYCNRDRFILSKGHCCAGLYSVLAWMGYFPREKLWTYAKFGSPFMSHASHKVPGVEFSTGSLGHGLSFGVGKAMYLKRIQNNAKVYVLLGDGELNEGSNWEALMFAAHHRLDNLCIIVDKNELQSLTSTTETLNLGDLEEKFSMFGWFTQSVNAHSHDELKQAFTQHISGKPHAIVAHSTKGYPISFMQNKVEWHYKTPSPAETLVVKQEILENYEKSIY